MRGLLVFSFAMVAVLLCTPALAQNDCAPRPRGGGLVGGVDRVTRQIGGEGCGAPGDESKASESATECTGMQLAYSPATIRYRENGFASVTYAPPGCRRPSGQPDYEIAGGASDVFTLLPSGTVSVSANETASATVRATHGKLPPATATVNSVALPDCTEMRLAYQPRTLHLDEIAKPKITFLPPGCVEPPRATSIEEATQFTVSDPEVAWLYRQQGATNGELRGRAEGTARISARLANLSAQTTVAVVNAGPDCKSVSLSYPGPIPVTAKTSVADDTGVSPRVSYEPASCKHPAGAPSFETTTPSLVSVAAKTGVLEARKPGSARVGVKHGNLVGFATVEITAVPACDKLYMTYDLKDSELMLHTQAEPRLDYVTLAAQPQFSNVCTKPPGEPQFSTKTISARDGKEALELARDGAVKGASVGSATVTATHGPLEASAYVKVVDGKPCEKLTGARYEPATIAPGQTAKIRLSYEPAGCMPPENPVRFALPPPEDRVELHPDGTVVGRYPGHVWVRLSATSSELQLRAGDPAVDVSGRCESFTINASPPTIDVGRTGVLQFHFKPDGCVERPVDSAWKVEASNDAVAVSFSGGAFVFRGVRGGQARIRAMSPDRGAYDGVPAFHQGEATVAVTAPACREIVLSYKPNVVAGAHSKTGESFIRATLTYKPEGCTRPPGNPTFTSDSGNFGVLTDGTVYVHAAPESRTYPDAIVTVTHGGLSGDARVKLAD